MKVEYGDSRTFCVSSVRGIQDGSTIIASCLRGKTVCHWISVLVIELSTQYQSFQHLFQNDAVIPSKRSRTEAEETTDGSKLSRSEASNV